MDYLNSAEGDKPTLPIDSYHLRTPPEEYDLNCLVPLRVLESSDVRLEPFIACFNPEYPSPSLHAEHAFSLLQGEENRELYKYLPYGPFATLAEFLTWLEVRIRSDRHSCLFLITDLSRPLDDAKPLSRVAGWIGLLNLSIVDLIGEIGHVTVLKRAWKTHANTHASCLLLKYLLTPRPDGLAFRRVSWLAHKENQNSNGAAERLGFFHEGTIRYARILRHDKEGIVINSNRGMGRAEEGKARDTHVWSVTWEDWERRGKEASVESLLTREVKRNPAWES
ncbi:hypothetical protein DRE_06518 [Drechslerella stenobrocha 248]|uniref:N-acetyltransferase domain-containing protein n=1 Tax=Drechslerella stenobrocha 248 TaxID=1043628 RepID=W7I707_9PEZI|nr:hypothetical protein DRE_06518 [Drechslerella stenobrocha 248]